MKVISILLFCINFYAYSVNLPTNSIVKIHTSASISNYKYPWQTSNIFRYVGSGVIIEGNQILTSAHVVSGAKFIEVQKENDPKKYIATVKFISHQSDLAIVEVYNGLKTISQLAIFFEGRLDKYLEV